MIDLNSLQDCIEKQNIFVERLRLDNKRLKEENKTLKEENILLKNEIAWLKDHTKYNGITEEHYIDGTMTATEAKLRLQQAEDNKNYISKLEEENKKLSEENGQLKEEGEELKIWLREKLPLTLLKEYMAKFEGIDLENI